VRHGTLAWRGVCFHADASSNMLALYMSRIEIASINYHSSNLAMLRARAPKFFVGDGMTGGETRLYQKAPNKAYQVNNISSKRYQSMA
jgi:hypothetical protein